MTFDVMFAVGGQWDTSIRHTCPSLFYHGMVAFDAEHIQHKYQATPNSSLLTPHYIHIHYI